MLRLVDRSPSTLRFAPRSSGLRAKALLGSLLCCMFPGQAAAQDAGPEAAAIDAGVATDARTSLPVVRRRSRVIDFEDDADGPGGGEVIQTRNPEAVKYKSLMPDKYKRPPGASATAPEPKRGRGCAGCANTGHPGAMALALLLLALAMRRHR